MGSSKFHLIDLKNRVRWKYVSYPDGEAVIQELDGKNRFKSTNGARQYLKMKNAQGELVPINTATFEQFTLK